MAGLSQWQRPAGARRAGTAYPGALEPPVNPALADLLEVADTDKVHVLRALLHISQAVLCARYFDEVLEAVAHHSLTALGAASVSISRWERQADVLRTLINVGDLGPDEERWPENELYSVDDDRQVVRLLKQGLPYVNSIDDANSNPDELVTLRQLQKESELAVPVMYNDVMWGELWATGVNGRRFGPDDVQVFQAIAAHMAVAIGRSKLFSAVWRQAFEDPLTGLANRRGLDEMFDDIDIEDVRPAIIMCDLDFFKQVNDQHGHPAGDTLLRQVANALDETASNTPGSAVARMGGDEFCIVLPHSTIADAERFARAASRLIGAQAGQHVSLSWGVAVYGPQIGTWIELVAVADAALLEAKRLGPGRLSTVTPGAIHQPHADRRRTGQVSAQDRAAGVVPRVIRLLDDQRPTSTATALEVLGVQVCGAIEAAAWAISLTTDDGTGVGCIRGVRSYQDGASGLRVLAPCPGTVYLLSNYPSTARAIATGEAFIAAVDLDDCDPTEITLLEEFGYRAVLVVPVSGDHRQYLLEIYSDVGHAQLAAIAPYVRVLAHYCSTFTTQQR